jgi:molybdate transport system substrate-binding protein
MRSFKRIRVNRLLGYLLFFPVCLSVSYGQITIAAASNVQYALEEIKPIFEQDTKCSIKTIYGASGKLAFQIRTGAPFDVFVSADINYPDSLVKWGYAQGTPTIYAYGKLVLWTLKDLDLKLGMMSLENPKITKIAIPDPKRAPYGGEAIKAMQKGRVFDKVSSKIIYCENVSQAAQYILTQNVDIGFCAKSVVLAKDMQNKGKWIDLDSTHYEKIAQSAVMSRYGQNTNPELSKKFMDFMKSPKAQAILKKYGYDLP